MKDALKDAFVNQVAYHIPDVQAAPTIRLFERIEEVLDYVAHLAVIANFPNIVSDGGDPW